MRAGIPGCLSYHYLSPLYRAFLGGIGVEIRESGPTTSGDLGRLALCPTDEPCVSVKVAFAHAKRLLDDGVDALFVPTVVSLSATAYCCPKMMGLPSMLRSGLDLDPRQVVSPVIDMKDDPRNWRRSWVRAAWMLGVGDASMVMKALDEGLSRWHGAEQEAVRSVARPPGGTVTAIMGHAYVLEDIFARKVPDVARQYGEVVFPEMLSREDALAELRSVPDGGKMWTIEGQILGASLYLLRKRLVDRMIFVSAFSCGPASIIENYIGKEAEERGVPFLNIAVDEHTGEAGLVTRMEAFLDSAGRARRRTLSCPAPRPVARATNGRGGRIGLVSMGNLDVPLDTLLREIGCETVPAPPLSDAVVALGKEVAPEFICYPMVTVIGQVRAHERQGVDRVVMVQGKGRCRLGWYAQVMQEILDRNGCRTSIMAIDSPFPLRQKGRATAEFIRALAGKVEPLRIARALQLAFAKLEVIDRANETLCRMRAYEERRGAVQIHFDRFLRDMYSARSLVAIARAYRRYGEGIREVPVVECDPLHVSLVGEIYVVNEPFVNKDVEKVLGSLEQRVYVHRRMTISGWVNYHLFKTPGAVREYRRVAAMAEPYLPVAVGGHGQESVGETVLAKTRGHDGVLHLFPFTCMPEIIAQNVLVKTARDLDLPVLSLMLSEQTGVAGLTTRLEAFCDLLEGRRRGKPRDEAHSQPVHRG